MTIELDGFEIEGSKLIGRYSKFNLYRLHKREKGKKAGEIVRKAEWYDASIEQCFKTIVQSKLSTLGKVDADEFLKKYEEITTNLQKDINKVVDAFNKIVESNKA